jgi:hypothetical protein
MLSILAFPKPFRGHIATIQRNAISSWMRLRPPCEIFLFGDEEGTAEVAKEFGACHISEMARTAGRAYLPSLGGRRHVLL